MKQDFLIFLDFSRKLWTNRFMLKMMTDRELKAKYVGSFFGVTWAVIDPLVLMAIYGVVFGVFFKSKPNPIYGTDSFMLFLICGLVPWHFVSHSMNSCVISITKNSNLIKKAVGFPSEILPVVTVFSNMISHLIGVLILLLFTIALMGKLSPWAFMIFIYLFFISLFVIGLGWIVSSLSVYLKDLRQVTEIIVLAWFHFTPIYYNIGVIPEKALWVLKLNPVFHMVEGYRFVLLAGRPPDMFGLVYLIAVSVVTFAIGGIFFRRLKQGFADVI